MTINKIGNCFAPCVRCKYRLHIEHKKDTNGFTHHIGCTKKEPKSRQYLLVRPDQTFIGCADSVLWNDIENIKRCGKC